MRQIYLYVRLLLFHIDRISLQISFSFLLCSSPKKTFFFCLSFRAFNFSICSFPNPLPPRFPNKDENVHFYQMNEIYKFQWEIENYSITFCAVCSFFSSELFRRVLFWGVELLSCRFGWLTGWMNRYYCKKS